jgi:hypothetical protein
MFSFLRIPFSLSMIDFRHPTYLLFMQPVGYNNCYYMNSLVVRTTYKHTHICARHQRPEHHNSTNWMNMITGACHACMHKPAGQRACRSRSPFHWAAETRQDPAITLACHIKSSSRRYGTVWWAQHRGLLRALLCRLQALLLPLPSPWSSSHLVMMNESPALCSEFNRLELLLLLLLLGPPAGTYSLDRGGDTGD